MSNLVILGLMAFAWYGMGLPAPFSSQVSSALGALAPWVPLLAAAFIFRDAAGRIVQDLYGRIVGALEALGALILTLLAMLFIAPVMIADTFLLGGLAQWAWKHQIGPIILVVLSSIALALIGGFSREVMRKYLVAAIAVGVAVIVWGYVSQSWTNTRRIVYKIDAGRAYSDPAAGLRVKAGDRLVFSAFGKTKFAWPTPSGTREIVLGPEGDLGNVVVERAWGEMLFEVMVTKGALSTVYVVPIQEVEAGPTDILGFDPSDYSGGYYLSGEARIPAGADGKLMIGFHAVRPPVSAHDGSIRMIIQVNPEKSFVGRMLNQRGYFAVLAVLGWTIAVFGAYGFLVAVILPQKFPVMRPMLLAIAVVLWLATIGAARDITGVNSWGEMWRLTGGFGVIGGANPTATPFKGVSRIEVLLADGRPVPVDRLVRGGWCYTIRRGTAENLRLVFADSSIPQPFGHKYVGWREIRAMVADRGTAAIEVWPPTRGSCNPDDAAR